MPWSYSAGLLTATGGTEAAPNSVMAGIGVVAPIDSTKAYRDGLVGWLTDVEIRVASGAFIIFDDDSTTLLRALSFVNPTSGGIIHGNRSTFILETTISKFDGQAGFQTGATFIARRQNPNDPNPKIVYRNTGRMDYPYVAPFTVLAKVDIAGIDFYKLPGSSSDNFLGLAFGSNPANIVKNIRLFGGNNYRPTDTTFDDLYVETLETNLYGTPNFTVFNRPVYYRATPSSHVFGRAARVTIRNPTYLNSCLNVAGPIVTVLPFAGSWLKLVYTFKHTFKLGLTNLQNVKVRYLRARQSAQDADWAAPTDGLFELTTNASGTYTAIDLMDLYRQDTVNNAFERFNWSAKARGYDKKTPAENIFSNRVLFQQPANMSAGYLEDVQMLQVPHLTLTEAQANALTGITLTPSGATGGVVALSSARTVAQLWHFYRAWISQAANFNSDDTWGYDGAALSLGAWTITGVQHLSAGSVVTSSATAAAAFSVSVTGNVLQATPTNLSGVTVTGNLTYNQATDLTVTLTNATVTGTVSNSGAGVIGIYPVGTSSLGTLGANVVALTVPKYVNVTGLVAGSRVQLYNVTTATILDNLLVAGTTHAYTITAANNDVIRLRVTKVGQLPFENFTVFSGVTIGFVVNQLTDTIYNSYGIDGSTVTKFEADFANAEVDLVVASNFTAKEFYAWYRYTATTEQGINIFFGGISAVDSANIKINNAVVNLYFDTETSANVFQDDNIRIYRADEAYPVKNPTTGGGAIDLVWRNQVYIAETGVSGLTSSESATLSKIDALTESAGGLRFTPKALEATPAGWATLAQIEGSTVLAKEASVAALPTNPLLANDARLSNLDAAVSSRLSSAGYLPPANADVAAIKAKTDTLVNAPTLAQIEASVILGKRADIQVVNEGVKKASLIIPHSADLPA